MKKLIIILCASIAIGSCTNNFDEAVDFTRVENPNLSVGSVVGQPNSSQIWLSGLEREISLTLNDILILSELGSDNYVNTQTFFNQFLDDLDIRTTDPDIRNTQYRIHRLRESARFGLEEVGPADPEYNAEIEAEYHFFEGMSYLYAAMYFSGLPQEELGEIVSSEQNYNFAISSFEAAIGANPQPEYYLAMARAHYYLGDKPQAVTAASQALAIDPTFTREAEYDAANGPTNRMQDAIFDRATFDDLQPLPTLDFLDPKYSRLTASVDASVHYLKAEEAHLILAEANISDDDLAEAKLNLEDLLELVETREVRTINDATEGRTQVAPGTRPDNSSVVVNGRAGLVLDRDESVEVSSVSGTSLTQSEINALSAEDEALKLLYRTRQEVFIAEGLRFVDMGVKLVIAENELLQNPNVSEGDPSTVPVIPSFIEAVIPQLDAITYNADNNTATTAINLTDVLVANKTSPLVLPFN